MRDEVGEVGKMGKVGKAGEMSKRDDTSKRHVISYIFSCIPFKLCSLRYPLTPTCICTSTVDGISDDPIELVSFSFFSASLCFFLFPFLLLYIPELSLPLGRLPKMYQINLIHVP